MFKTARTLLARAASWLALTLAATPRSAQDRPERRAGGVTAAAVQAAQSGALDVLPDRYVYPLRAPVIPASVTPGGVTAAVAMDSTAATNYASMPPGQFAGFPGYAYLSGLALRPEFRLMSDALATEMCREWIEFYGDDSDGEADGETIKQIESEFESLGVREKIHKAISHDAQFGLAHIYLDVNAGTIGDPLILDPRTVPEGSFKGISIIEPMWTTPAKYDSLDPTSKSFYKPYSWYSMGKEYHASRLLTFATREVPDIFKPAFNFGGISLYQLVEPTIDNWLHTRKSVSDLVHRFSLTAIATDMGAVLDGSDPAQGANLANRARLFVAHRNNRGLMMIDKENEELIQINTPLTGLHELQAQAQEQMCMYSHTPAVKLTGLSPTGLNASSEGEIRSYYDWISSQQEAHMRKPIQTILELVQLSKFGKIDKRIGFRFVPLYQMTPEQEATIQEKKANVAGALIDRGVIDPSEAREALASDKNSGYHGIDVDSLPVMPAETEKAPEGAETEEV